jgi:hypothetical protein
VSLRVAKAASFLKKVFTPRSAARVRVGTDARRRPDGTRVGLLRALSATAGGPERDPVFARGLTRPEGTPRAAGAKRRAPGPGEWVEMAQTPRKRSRG